MPNPLIFQDFFELFVEELLLILGVILLGLSIFYIVSIYHHRKEKKNSSNRKERWEEKLRKASQDKNPKAISKIDSSHRDKFKAFLAKDGPDICSDSKILKKIYKNQGFFKEDLELIKEGSWWEKTRAIVRLKKLNIEEAEENISNLLTHERLEIRLASLDYLSNIQSSKIENYLEDLFEKNSENLDQFLLIRLFLADLRPQSLENFVHSSKTRLRKAAAIILGKEGQEEGLPLLNILSEDEDPKVRLEVARSIGRIGSKKGLDLLSKLKTDDDADVRGELAKAVGKIGDVDGLSLLEELAQDEAKKVKLQAFLSLSKLGEPGREIISKYRSEDPKASREALLSSFTGEV